MSLNGSTLGPFIASVKSGDAFYLVRVPSGFFSIRLAVRVSPLSCFTDGIIGTDLRVFRFFFATDFDSELLAPCFKY